MKDLISVIMPVYNNEKYLAQAIESVLNQTHDNLELLILNDGSEDNSLSIMEKYALDNEKIQIISRENKGISNCISELLDYANGDYIARMNGDDISYSNRLEYQLKYLKENNLNLVGSYVDIEIVDDESPEDKEFCEKIFNFKLDDLELSVKILNGHKICHGTFLGKKSLFEKVNYSLNFKVYEDVDFIFNVIKEKFKIGIIDKKLYLNRITPKFIYEHRNFNVKYNQENLTAKIKFLKDSLKGKKIYILGMCNESKILVDVLKNFSLNVESVVSDCENIKDLCKSGNYLIILDRENSESIEGKLNSMGMSEVSDFITF